MNFSMSDLELISTIVATLASSYLDIHRVPDSFSIKLLFFSRTYLSAGNPYSVQLMEPSSLPYISSSIECWSAAEQASVFASMAHIQNSMLRASWGMLFMKDILVRVSVGMACALL